MIDRPIVEVAGLSKRFGNLAVIDDLSFSLAPGEALGVVGPNGAGKTTTLNLIAGDLRPTTGSVRFAGENVTQLGSHRRCRLGIGRTSQVPRPFEGLSVFENVLVGASFGRAPRGEREAIDASVARPRARRHARSGQRARRGADAAPAQAARAGPGAGDRPVGAAARRDRRRAHRGRGGRARRHGQVDPPATASRSSGSSTSCTHCSASSTGCWRWTTAGCSSRATRTR